MGAEMTNLFLNEWAEQEGECLSMLLLMAFQMLKQQSYLLVNFPR